MDKDNLPRRHLYDMDLIRPVIVEVLARLRDDAVPVDQLKELSRLLLEYSYEWLEPQKDEVYVAQSHEIPGALGCGSGPNGRLAALTAAVESHVEFLVTMIAAGQPLPQLLSGTVRRPQRTKMITIRLTDEEYQALSEAANIQSMNISEFVREMAVYRSTTPAEASDTD